MKSFSYQHDVLYTGDDMLDDDSDWKKLRTELLTRQGGECQHNIMQRAAEINWQYLR